MKLNRKCPVWVIALVLGSGAILAWWYWPEAPRQKVGRLLRGFDSQPKGKFDFSLAGAFVSRDRLDAEWERLGPDAVPALVEALNSDRYPMRYLAARRLSEIGDPAAVPGLIQALGDYDRIVRMWAAHALGDLRDPRAVESLIRCLKDEESCVRAAAATALGQCGDRRAVAPLIDSLCDESWRLQVEAVIALGCLGDPRAIGPIRQVMERDESTDIHTEGHLALSKLGAEEPGR